MNYYCKSCGTTGKPTRMMRWPAAIEVMLFLGCFCSLAGLFSASRGISPGNPFPQYGLGMLGIAGFVFLAFTAALIAYASFRRSMGFNVCAACGSRELIPTNSPVGEKMSQQQG
jgi:hypothetical protein